MNWVIYCLRDPRSKEVRYVVFTSRPKTRLTEHLYAYKRERNKRASWLKSLAKQGLVPELEILQHGSGVGWQACEQRWIQHFQTEGARLTNMTQGGEGTFGWHPTLENRRRHGEWTRQHHTGKKRSIAARLRMREAQLKRYALEISLGIVRPTKTRSPETRKRMAQAQQGKKASVAARRKMSLAHSNPSPEYRAKLRDAVLKRPLDQRKAFAMNQKGKPKSLETKLKISAARKAYWQRKKGAISG